MQCRTPIVSNLLIIRTTHTYPRTLCLIYHRIDVLTFVATCVDFRCVFVTLLQIHHHSSAITPPLSSSCYHKRTIPLSLTQFDSIPQVNGIQRHHAAPIPLATLDMQKRVTRELQMAGDQIMKMAEELYQGGFISYPRTETDSFSKDYDLKVTHALIHQMGVLNIAFISEIKVCTEIYKRGMNWCAPLC